MHVIRLPRPSHRALKAVGLSAVAALVASAFISPPVADAARPAAAAKPTVTVTATVTQTVTVTSPPETVTTTVTAPPETVTVTAPPQTVTVTAPATSATTTVEPTTATTTTTTVAPPPPASGWPDASNTGVPAGTVLTVIPGDYTITGPGTYDALDIRGTLHIRADGVTVTRSKVANVVTTDTGARSFTITDSELHSTNLDFKVFSTDRNFTVLRSEISGGNSGGMCSNCFLQDNWIHNPSVLPSNDTHHMSAWRMRQNTTLIHNTIACEVKQSAADGGCSAGLTGYGDFEPVTNNLIQGNLFQSMPYASFCAYGGASAGKPYSGQDHDIVFKDNVFERGSTGKCAVYASIGDWNGSRPGNQLINNRWDDGTPLPPFN